MAKSKRLSGKLLKVLLQAAVTAAALYIVLGKIDLGRLAMAVSHANPWYLVAAVICFNISKLINAVRLNRFFRAIGLSLPEWYNIKLYYLGMFYNLFLPGGIGGDGYKIYILQKDHGMKVINAFNAVFWDRVSGIFALLFLSALLLAGSGFAVMYPGQIRIAWAIAIAAYPLSLLLTRLMYRQFLPVFVPTAIESLLVQATQVVSAWFILLAISATTNQIDYLTIFLISSVATILPLTIGGAGAREVTFFYALRHLGLDINTGIALSLIFFVISAASSFIGVFARVRNATATEPGRDTAA